jgi:hypothetical protein
MATSPLSQPNQRDLHAGNLYCSDPNCRYCTDLRIAQAQWKKAQQEVRTRADAE